MKRANPKTPALQFDEQTGEAVRALQAMNGLPESGIVDAATRALLVRPRCSVPDSAAADPSEKWSHTGFGWTLGTTRKWRLDNTDDGLTTTQVKAALNGAFHAWSVATNMDFVEAPRPATPTSTSSR